MTGRTEKTILRLVDSLYACAAGDSSWPSFLNSLSEAFGASLVGLTVNSRLIAAVGVDPAEGLQYTQHYAALNPWLNNPARYPEGKMLFSSEILPHSAYLKTVFYNDWGKRNLVTHALGGAIRAHNNQMLFLSLNRGDSQKPFDEPQREAAQHLMPHLQRAVDLYDRFTFFEQRQWALDALAFPMMHVSTNRRLVWANRAAEQILAAAEGLYVRKGKLHAELVDQDNALRAMLCASRQAIAERPAGYGGWLRITRPGDGSEMSLYLVRAPATERRLPGASPDGDGFWVFITQLSVSDNLLADRLRAAWGLTPAEAALTIELLESGSLQAAAEKLSISRNTVKTQLASIFQKAGVRRQSELARKLVLLSVIGTASGPPERQRSADSR
jgi:DNA-binding CsgD family transcriptional regulator